MAAKSPSLRIAAARAGAAARNGDPSLIRETQRDLAAARIQAYIERVVMAAPPLTTEQRIRLAAMLSNEVDPLPVAS